MQHVEAKQRQQGMFSGVPQASKCTHTNSYRKSGHLTSFNIIQRIKTLHFDILCILTLNEVTQLTQLVL